MLLSLKINLQRKSWITFPLLLLFCIRSTLRSSGSSGSTNHHGSTFNNLRRIQHADRTGFHLSIFFTSFGVLYASFSTSPTSYTSQSFPASTIHTTSSQTSSSASSTTSYGCPTPSPSSHSGGLSSSLKVIFHRTLGNLRRWRSG